MSLTNDALGIFRLDGKVAVVAGGASGIGKATARLLARAGASVVVADSNLEGALIVAQELGGDSCAIAFDLADEPSIAALFQTTKARYSNVDILINSAGIYPRYQLDNLNQEQWFAMQNVNVWGCFVAMREAARHMRAGGRGGRIVNISSVGGLRTAVNDQLAYNASKAALDSMTLSAALEFGADDILVNSILPGAVLALDPKPKPPGHSPATGPLMAPGRILLRRPALADEIAGPILMLVSAAGAYITGQTIVVDGGFSIS